jgi:hypothetical protein
MAKCVLFLSDMDFISRPSRNKRKVLFERFDMMEWWCTKQDTRGERQIGEYTFHWWNFGGQNSHLPKMLTRTWKPRVLTLSVGAVVNCQAHWVKRRSAKNSDDVYNREQKYDYHGGKNILIVCKLLPMSKAPNHFQIAVQIIDITVHKKNSGALVRQRTIPTERPPLVGEVSALGIRCADHATPSIR